MMLPERYQRPQQVRAPEKRTVLRGGPAQCDVIAAAGSGMAAVQHELFGAEAGQPRLFVQRDGVVLKFLPGRRGMNVDLDHAGIRGDFQHIQRRIARRFVAFDQHRQAQRRRGILDRGQ